LLKVPSLALERQSCSVTTVASRAKKRVVVVVALQGTLALLGWVQWPPRGSLVLEAPIVIEAAVVGHTLVLGLDPTPVILIEHQAVDDIERKRRSGLEAVPSLVSDNLQAWVSALLLLPPLSAMRTARISRTSNKINEVDQEFAKAPLTLPRYLRTMLATHSIGIKRLPKPVWLVLPLQVL